MRPTKQPRLAEAEESKAAEAQGSKAAEAQQQKVAEAQGPKKFAFDYAIQTPKFRYCRICMKNDHSAPLCPYGRYCSPDVTVGPDAAIVCTCCHGDPKTAHPDVADVEMVTRAVLKSSLPRSRSMDMEYPQILNFHPPSQFRQESVSRLSRAVCRRKTKPLPRRQKERPKVHPPLFVA
ncbi:hypothetical protein ACFX2I_002381 [Malus domestica]